MKEPPLSRHKNPPPAKKIKFLCGFNGSFQPRPPSGKLRHVGGETRVVSIDRNIGISRLRSKISELCPNNLSFSLKYQLPDSEGVDGDLHLVLIAGDDDVRSMIDEYDKLESDGKPGRLWVFVCNENGYVGLKTDSFFNGFCSDSGTVAREDVLQDRRDTTCGLGGRLCGNVIGTEITATHVGRVQTSGHIFSPNALESKIPMSHLVGIRHDDSPRKMVFEQQNLATQVADFQGSRGLFISKTSELEIPKTCSAGIQNSEPLVPTKSTSAVQSIGNCYGTNVSDYKLPMKHLPGQCFGSLVPLPEIDMQPMKVNSGDVGMGRNNSMQFLRSGFGEDLVNGVELNAGNCNHSVATVQFLKQSNNPCVASMSTGSSVKQGSKNIERVPMKILNRENVMPWTAYCDSVKTCVNPVSCSNQLVGSVSPLNSSITNNREWDNQQCGIRNHRFSVGDIRNQRISSCYMRNHCNNLPEMGSRRITGFDGKPCLGKCYPGLRPNSSISKHGQAVRSQFSHFWKPWSGALEQAREGMSWMIESSKDSQPSFNLKNSRGLLRDRILQPSGRCPVDHVSEQGSLLATEFGNLNPPKNQLGYHGLWNGTCSQSLHPSSVMENPVPYFRVMTTAEDLLSDSNHAKHEIPSQTVCNKFYGTPVGSSHHPITSKPTCHGLNKEPFFIDLQKDVEISRCSIDTGYNNGSELGCKSVYPMLSPKVQLDPKADVKALSSCDDIDTCPGDVASPVHLSLNNLSLSSSKEVEPPTLSSSRASGDVLESFPRCEMAPQPNLLDVMDEEHCSSGPLIEKSDGVASNCTFKNPAAQLGKDLADGEENQQDTPSSLSIDKKAEFKGSQTCSKVDGGPCRDLAAFYTHLANRELQTIKNSDLEDIRELGSGTYGTVYHGKWKGSDVAIKRIKPSCFTGGEEDRLVADFWKEAHILGQLHHPNVLAFYGVVTDGPVTNLATVTEYMVNGSLKQVLQRKDRTIDRRKRLIIAMDAAFGMEYLHEKKIVHFDLKSHNFLVNMRDPQRPVCKIGDLGLSKIKQKTLVSGGVRGTVPWMAPELLASKHNMVTERVDVYSFGIVMWELLTGDQPYADLRSEEIIAGIIKGDLRPEVPSWCDPAWRSLMERCWSSDPDLRPPFLEIAKELRAMSAAMNIK